MLLFELAKELYVMFMKLKVCHESHELIPGCFPVTPRMIQLLRDGMVIREVWFLYAAEANCLFILTRDYFLKAGYDADEFTMLVTPSKTREIAENINLHKLKPNP